MNSDNVEQIVLEVDPLPAEDGAKKANAAVDSVGRNTEKNGALIVRTHDKSRNSVERLVLSYERLNKNYGASALDKAAAQHDQLIKRLGSETAAVDRANKAYSELKTKIEAAEKAGSGHGTGSPGILALRGFRDIFEGRTAYGEVMIGRSLMGLGGAGAALGGIAAALVAVELAGYKAAKAVGEYGMRVHDMQIKTGMSAIEVQKLDFAAKMVGEDVGVMDKVMRGLTQAVEGTDEKSKLARATLQGMGVDVLALRSGVLPTMQVLQQVSGALESQPSLWLRNKEAIELFNRAGITSLPLIVELNRSLKESGGIKFISEEQNKRFVEIHHELAMLTTEWDMFILRMKASLAKPFMVTIQFVKASAEGRPFFSVGLTGMDQATIDRALGQNIDRDPANEWLRNYAKLATSGGLGITSPTAGERMSRSMIGTNIEATEREAQRLRKSYDDMLGGGFVKHAVNVGGHSIEVETPATPSDIGKAAADYKRMDDSAKSLKKSESDRLSILEEIRKLTVEAADRAAHPYGMLPAERRLMDIIAKPGTRPSDVARETAILTPEIHQEVLENLRRAGLMVSPSGAIVRANVNPIWGGIGGTSAGIREIVAEKDIGARAVADAGNRRLEQALKQENSDLREELGSLRDIQSEARKYSEAGLLGGVRIASTLGADTLENRLSAERQIAEIRKKSADEEFESAKSLIAGKENFELAYEAIRIKHEGEIAAVQRELDQKRADEMRKQLDEIKGPTQGLLHTLFTSPSGFGKQLSGTLRDSALRPVESGMSEMIAGALHPLIFGSEGTSGIAAAMHGLFGGAATAPRGTANDPIHVVSVGQDTGSLGWMNAGYSGTNPIWGGIGGLPGSPSGFGAGNGFGFGSPDSPGGTPGFAPGSIGLGGGSSTGRFGGFNLPGILGNFKNINWGGFTRADLGGLPGINGQPGTDLGNTGRITGVNGLAGTALFAGGMMLAQHGLLGGNRGTWAGIGEGALGGAAIGLKFGGPLGAAIGGGIGGLIGIGEKIAGVETPQREAARLIRSIYGLNIDASSTTIKQVVAMAQQNGGSISIAVRSPQVRELLQLYADSTGQKSALLTAQQIHSGSLAQAGGRLYQSATYSNGTPYTYASSLPTLGPSGGIIPTSNPMTNGGVTVMLNPQQTVDLWRTGTSLAIAGDPRGVAQSAGNGNAQTAQRLNAAGMSFDPGAIWA